MTNLDPQSIHNFPTLKKCALEIGYYTILAHGEVCEREHLEHCCLITCADGVDLDDLQRIESVLTDMPLTALVALCDGHKEDRDWVINNTFAFVCGYDTDLCDKLKGLINDFSGEK